MTITNETSGNSMTISVEGRLDTMTAPDLEKYIGENLGETEELIFDLGKLEYISSAGLRVLLSTQKKMNKKGSMVLKNVNDALMEIFEVTGFCDILTFA